MTTEVEICSNALVLLGEPPIASLTEPTVRARSAAALFPAVRRAVLRSHPWNCATRRVILSPDVTPPEFDWTFRFLLPGDWLRTIVCGKEGEEHEYRIEGRYLLADENPLYLRYIFLNDQPANWDALLIDAVTLAMGARLAKPITGSETAKDQLQAELRDVMRTARAVDGQENPPETLGDFPLRRARG